MPLHIPRLEIGNKNSKSDNFRLKKSIFPVPSLGCLILLQHNRFSSYYRRHKYSKYDVNKKFTFKFICQRGTLYVLKFS